MRLKNSDIHRILALEYFKLPLAPKLSFQILCHTSLIIPALPWKTTYMRNNMDNQRKISLSQGSKSFGITSLRLENEIDAAIIPLPSSSSTSLQSSGSVQHVAPVSNHILQPEHREN